MSSRDASELATSLLTARPRGAFRRPAPRTGSPPAPIGGTTPTDDPASLGAAALIAKGEAAVRLGRYERANEAFAAARAVTAAEKERGSPPSFSGLGDGGERGRIARVADVSDATSARAAPSAELESEVEVHDALEAKAASERDALEAKAAEREAASEASGGGSLAAEETTGEAETRKRIEDATIADLRAELRAAEGATETQRRRAEDAGGKLRVAESEAASAALARSSLEVENAELNARVETLRAETETLRAEMERLRAEMEATIAAHASRAAAAETAETVARRALAAEVDKSRREIDDAIDGRTNAETAMAAAEKRAADATHRAANVDEIVASVREECEVLVAEREAECEVRMRRAREQLEKASAEVARTTANAEASEAARADAVADAEDARACLEAATRRAEEANRREEEANRRAEEANRRADAAEVAASEIADAARAAKEAAASDALARDEREAELSAELSAVRGSVDAARTKATEAVARATRDLGKRRELFSETLADVPDAFQKSLDSIRAGTASANAAAKTACDALEAALDGGYGRARVCVAESRGNDDDCSPVVLAAGAEASAFVAPNDRLPASSLAHLCVLAVRADASVPPTGLSSRTGTIPDDPGSEEVRFLRGVTALRGSGNADDPRDWKRLETTGNMHTDPPFAAAQGAGVAIALRGTSSGGVVRVLCADTRARDSPLSVADLAAAHETAMRLAAVYAADADRVRAWTRRVIRARWAELDNGGDTGDDDKENGAGGTGTGTTLATGGDYRFDTPAGAARVLFELAAHKRTLESLFHEGGGFEHDLLRRLSSLGAPDGALALPPALAAPVALSAWAACACVGTADAQPPPFARVDAAAFTAFADAATATDAYLAERRREDARVAGLAALGIETRRAATDATGTSSDDAKPRVFVTEATLRATGEAAARRASVLWTEGGVRDSFAALTGTNSPMSATKIRALTADRDLRDAVRALLAAAAMLRPALDGDREWREMGGFDCARAFGSAETQLCARLWAWAATCACAWRARRRVRAMRMDEGAVLAILDGMERAARAAARVPGATSEGDGGIAMIGDGRDGGEVD